MWDQKKKYKKIVVGVLLVLALALGVGQWRFQSVDSYRKEQKQAAKELGLELEEGQSVQDGEWNGSEAGSEDEAGEHLKKEREEKDGKSTGQKKKNEAKNNKKQKNKKGESIKPAGDSSDKKTGSGAKQGEKKNNHSSQSSKDKSSGKSGNDQKDKKPSTGVSGKDSETASSGTDSSGENSTSSGENGSTSDSSSSSGGGNEKPGKDTSATPDNKRPVATSTAKPQEKITCTIQIRCDSLVANKNKIDSELWKYIPSNGMILTETKITVDKGTSAYDALNQVCKAKNIAMDSEYTAMYKSYYVKGIGHLYEKQAGDMSGWIYKVNGKAPNKGSSSFILSDGDSITWAYTCDGKTT